MALQLGTLVGPYRIVGPLLQGGSGYRAEDTRSGRAAAIKLLPDVLSRDPQRLARIERDLHVLGSLNHPNIAAIYGIEDSAAGKAIATELVEGSILTAPLPRKEALEIAAQVAEALGAGHRNGITHRNLKAANILVTPAGQVKLLDFGLDIGGSADSAGEAPAASIAMTREVGDIRAFGSLLTEMLGLDDEQESTLPLTVQEVLTRSLADDSPGGSNTMTELAALLKSPPDREPEQGQPISVRASFLAENGESNPQERPNTVRYVDLGVLGAGGMGEVRRVRDLALNRVLAMKIIKPEVTGLGRRFVQEARITAQLQHPAIVPVHEIGTLSDGRIYFTMKEVQGHTLSKVIKQAHKAWRMPEETRPEQDKWTLRQLVGFLQRASEGVGYAHDRGVLHRDLKPANMMIGAFGEVLVLDWGLTRIGEVQEGMPDGDGPAAEPITDSSRGGDRTRFGSVMGTVHFMAPEQAMGDIDRINARSDVFSLGCVLYNILTGSKPFDEEQRNPIEVLLKGSVKEIGSRAGGEHGPLIPSELLEICRKAMAREPADRYANGGQFAGALASWLDGAQRREQAIRVLDQARELKPKAQAIVADARGLESQAAAILAMIPPFAPVDTKRGAWAMQDRANQLRNQAEELDARFINTVHAALSLSDDLAPAHQMLAEHYKERHALAEAAHDEVAVVRYQTLLGVHDDGRFSVYLKGDGKLTLTTEPPGAKADLYRFEPVERRLIPHLLGEVGTTPLTAQSLPMGSYILRLSHPGRVAVQYPVYIEREFHWDGVRPGASSTHPIYLPKAGDLSAAECYVPAGWFWSGGDRGARNGLPGRRLWLDGFVTPRDAVTMGDYLVYLNDLIANGREMEAGTALPEIPQWEAKEEASDREYGYSRDASGRFVFDGGEERLSLPVAWVSWHQARAYCEWLAAYEKVPWRLMQEMEHEKASRGVDGRYFPWGNHFDATFCAMRDSHPGAGRVMRFTVNEFPLDESPYGVRGCAGNTFAWCEDAYSPTGPTVIDGIPYPPNPSTLHGPGAGGAHRIIRGGSYRDNEAYCRTSCRDCPPAICHYDQIGFRIARSLP